MLEFFIDRVKRFLKRPKVEPPPIVKGKASPPPGPPQTQGLEELFPPERAALESFIVGKWADVEYAGPGAEEGNRRRKETLRKLGWK